MNTTIIFLILAYFILCIGIGNWSNSKRRGFGLGFFVSLFLSPIVGLMVIAIIQKKNPMTESDTRIVISDKTKTIIIRSLAIITISYAVLIWIDLIIPSQKSDVIMILDKHEINHPKVGIGRGVVKIFFLFSHYSISGKGQISSSGYVGQEFYETVQLNDTVKVSFCPLSMKWRYLELIKNGAVVMSELSNEVPSSWVFSIFFLIPCIAFKSPKWWWDKPFAWIMIWMSVGMGIFSWIGLFSQIF